MGRRELGTRSVKLKRFDLGYFPNKEFDDIPDGGCANDTKHVFFRNSDLRPFPGMALVNTAQAAHMSGQGLHYINTDDTQKRVAVFGNMFFEDVGGVWTNRTGTATIGVGDRVQFIDHQRGSNDYVIGCAGNGSPPFRWTGSGNAAALGGSPPNFDTMAKYHRLVFGAVDESVYFSDTDDPTTWDTTNWVIQYSKNVNCLMDNGAKLAVMMGDHIGSIQGYDALDIVAEDSETRTVGCVGKLAATNCFWGQADLKVIATVSDDGLWVLDQAFGSQNVFGDQWFYEFNKSNLSKSSMAYWRDEGLLFVAMPYGASSEPDYLVIVNTRTGAFWPGPTIHANYIRALASMKDNVGNEFIYFVDSNGYAFRFDMDATAYHTGTAAQAIDFKWKSKRFDLENIHSLGELNMIAGALGKWGVNVGVQFGLSTGDGSTGTVTFSTTEALLGSTFILGASALGTSDYVFKPLSGIGGYGRFLQITLLPQGAEANDLLGTTFVLGTSTLGSSNAFRVKRIEMDLHDHRRGGYDQ